MNGPLVSIIIPTYNSAPTLDACIRSIMNQTYKNIEIIIVDNFSTDKTIDIVHMYDIKVIQCSTTRSRARNIAAGESSGEFIFSIDSDMELTKKVVEECVKKSKAFDSIIVSEISFGIGFWTRCKVLERKCYIGDDTIESARFFSKNVFEMVNGYDPLIEFGEDWDIYQRIKNAGFKIGRIESLIMHNEGNLNFWKNMRKKYLYGKTLEKYMMKHPKDFSRQSILIRPAFVRNWKLLAEKPLTCFGMLFMKCCEFLSMWLGLKL